jgi:hypothetical protein
MDIWNRLYRERILYIGQDLDDEFANQVKHYFIHDYLCFRERFVVK